ncbi:DUF4262 domain-containing protein [Nocardioides caeni]|uniref:DUF4262 domain-containing protein n=1 Tax=Nocardioides caeni TaxID=574700 RepID=A0A4S8N6C0_9ACTN|nr:DUF4262 domain-containing protein [Nocardioides caeni]
MRGPPMCWKCDHPQATDEDYLGMIQGHIEARDYFIQGVEADRWRPGFTYTVGLTLHGHPELLVTGLPHRTSVRLLDGIAHQLVRHGAEPYRAGDLQSWPVGVDDSLPRDRTAAEWHHGQHDPGKRLHRAARAGAARPDGDQRGRAPGARSRRRSQPGAVGGTGGRRLTSAC